MVTKRPIERNYSITPGVFTLTTRKSMVQAGPSGLHSGEACTAFLLLTVKALGFILGFHDREFHGFLQSPTASAGPVLIKFQGRFLHASPTYPPLPSYHPTIQSR
jgi:hypothetical protein